MTSFVTKRSTISGITRTIELKQYTQEEFNKRHNAWVNKELLIHEAFPELSSSEREFIMTGMTESEWDELVFYEDDEEE